MTLFLQQNFKLSSDPDLRISPHSGTPYACTIVKVSEDEFRYDYEMVVSLIPPLEAGEGFFYRDLTGKMQKKIFEGGVISQKSQPDGSILMEVYVDEDKTQKETFSCLPIMKISSSASVKFDAKNNSTVEFDCSVSAYSKELEYRGPTSGKGIISISDTQSESPMIKRTAFYGRDNATINTEIDRMLSVLKVSTDIKFKQKLEEYKASPDKDIVVGMELYEKFFSKMKKHYPEMKKTISDTEKQVLRGAPGSKVKVIGAMQFAILQAYHPDKMFQLKKKSAKTIRKVKESMNTSLSFLRKKDKSDIPNDDKKPKKNDKSTFTTKF